MGMTAMSWKRSTEKALRPPAVTSCPFSPSVWRTMAVEERARIIPTATD